MLSCITRALILGSSFFGHPFGAVWHYCGEFVRGCGLSCRSTYIHHLCCLMPLTASVRLVLPGIALVFLAS